MLVPMEASTAPRHVLGRAAPDATAFAAHRSWTPMVLETHGTLGLSSSSKNDTLATSSAILCFALHARVQESCGRIVELDFGTKLRVDQEAAGWGCQWWHSQPPQLCYCSMAR